MRPLPEKIIAYEHVLPEIDPQKEIRKSIDFLKDYLKEHPFLQSYVLGNFRWSRFNLNWESSGTWQFVEMRGRDWVIDSFPLYRCPRFPYGRFKPDAHWTPAPMQHGPFHNSRAPGILYPPHHSIRTPPWKASSATTAGSRMPTWRCINPHTVRPSIRLATLF